MVGFAGLSWAHPGPIVLISEDGRLMAVRAADGGLAFSSLRSDRFTREIWLRADGRPRIRPWPAADEADEGGDGRLICDPRACLYRRDGLVLALLRDARAVSEDCTIADIIVASVPVPPSCRAGIVIDRFDVWHH